MATDDNKQPIRQQRRQTTNKQRRRLGGLEPARVRSNLLFCSSCGVVFFPPPVSIVPYRVLSFSAFIWKTRGVESRNPFFASRAPHENKPPPALPNTHYYWYISEICLTSRKTSADMCRYVCVCVWLDQQSPAATDNDNQRAKPNNNNMEEEVSEAVHSKGTHTDGAKRRTLPPSRSFSTASSEKKNRAATKPSRPICPGSFSTAAAVKKKNEQQSDQDWSPRSIFPFPLHPSTIWPTVYLRSVHTIYILSSSHR